MIEQELAQRAILEALEGKIEALRGSGELHEGSILKLFLEDDLLFKFPRGVFMAATNEEVSVAISKVAEGSSGRFKFKSITPTSKKHSPKPGIFYPVTGVEEFPQEIPMVLYWEILYSEKLSKNPEKETPTQKPELYVEGSMGYLKFYRQGARVPIGKIDTRKYRLLSVLFSPLGVAKNIDVVFDGIKNSKDSLDGKLKEDYLANNRKREIIDNTMGELQKIKGLKGRISLKYHHDYSTVLLNLK